jgi:hypothetical protein
LQRADVRLMVEPRRRSHGATKPKGGTATVGVPLLLLVDCDLVAHQQVRRIGWWRTGPAGFRRLGSRVDRRWPSAGATFPTPPIGLALARRSYAIGGLASFWLVQRMAGF